MEIQQVLVILLHYPMFLLLQDTILISISLQLFNRVETVQIPCLFDAENIKFFHMFETFSSVHHFQGSGLSYQLMNLLDVGFFFCFVLQQHLLNNIELFVSCFFSLGKKVEQCKH